MSDTETAADAPAARQVIPGAGPTGGPEGGDGAVGAPGADPHAPAAGDASPGHDDTDRTAARDRYRAAARDRDTLRLREDDPAAADDVPRYAPEWLELREGADAAARSAELPRAALPPGGRDVLVVHDLGCGTGSMGRWLAPLLPGPQHWILHDRDPYLLHFAAAGSPRTAADGSRVTVETRRADVARLTPDAFAGATLVTASALLDVLTRDEVDRLAAACAEAACPALLTLTVAGRVELGPADPLDAEIEDAFNAHQRRTGLLGPDAVTAACEAFDRHGATVRVRPSPWRLGPGERRLTRAWLGGRVAAAVEQRPDLADRAEAYLARRLEACDAGGLTAVVHHADLLAVPGATGPGVGDGT
ncbi:class I SAM-dependent methyltransferase [Streptomyces sp. NPDC090306]|uniref:class I SAM-dependent methyltransferase n=1 Tax=Streptomyces sp. NPDC090306 TaxID=3365961 RepID=UPI00382512DC